MKMRVYLVGYQINLALALLLWQHEAVQTGTLAGGFLAFSSPMNVEAAVSDYGS
jgi:hypothetical protein